MWPALYRHMSGQNLDEPLIIDDNIERPTKTISKNFLADPNSLDKLNKKYNEIMDKKKSPPKKFKVKKKEEKAIFYDIFIKPKEAKIQEIHNKRVEEKKL